ncbi:MAG: ATP-binding protein [Negativicutes bacterium]|nr:ATP-binding protein [Negativicutes bacterium]
MRTTKLNHIGFGSRILFARNATAVIIAFTVIMLAVVWTGLAIKMHAEKQLEIQSAFKSTDNLARIFEEHTLRTIRSADQIALLVKQQYERQGAAIDMQPFAFFQTDNAEPPIAISIVNEAGDMLQSNKNSLVYANLRDREYFKVHQETDSGLLFIGKPILGGFSGKWSIPMSRRINKADGSFGGIVVVAVDPFSFTRFYRDIDLGERGLVALVGRDGIIRARQAGELSAVGIDLNPINSQLMKKLTENTSGSYTAQSAVDGVSRFHSFRALPDYQLVVLVGIAEQEAMAEFYRRTQAYIVFGLILSALSIGCGFILMRMKRLEQEVAKLDRFNLIGEMAAGIGHEIRNPMTTVRGFLQMLAKADRYAKDREYFAIMIEELDRANAIIGEYLSLAKNKIVDKKPLNLNEVINSLWPLIQADAIMHNKSILLELGEIPKLLLDEREIRQLILNMVRNGLEAMPPGGKLTLSTYREKDNVVLAIADEGKGIEPHILPKLGTPFFTTKENGTGLGLAICYSIAARHRASIRVATSKSGTTFFIQFRADSCQ